MDPQLPERLPVLLVDDDLAFRAELARTLAKLGCEVRQCASVSDAKNIIEGNRSPIVFISAELPNAFNGVEFIRVLVAREQDTLVAAYTQHSDQDRAIAAIRAGASDFLRRPLAEDDLRSALQRFRAIISRRENRRLRREFIEGVQLHFSIRSCREAIAPVVWRIGDLLTSFLDPREEQRLEVALEEVIRNAFEHGNLGITFNEKSAALDSSTFDALVDSRSRIAQDEERKIEISVDLDHRRFICTIRDDGAGFEWRSHVGGATEGAANESPRLHGRGLLIAKKSFDSVTFNEKGNEVTLMRAL